MTHMTRFSRLATLLVITASGLRPQTPQSHLTITTAPKGELPSASKLPNLYKAELLPVGKTQGTFHINGFVRKDKSIVLRWANTHGEMPTEGVTVWRLKAGDKETGWKEISKGGVGFFQGSRLKDTMSGLKPESREALMSLFHSDLQHDPATKRRMVGSPAGDAKDFDKLTPEKVLQQYRTLRNGGRLAKHDLQMLHASADMDASAASLFGLGFTDKPGSGKWKYKIIVKLPEKGTVEVVCPKEFDASVPTPVPSAINLSAKSGNGSVLLNWDAPPSDVVAGYNIYRSAGPSGPWKLINSNPVKMVKIETEDPESAMRRMVAEDAALEKEMRKNSGQALTPLKAREMRVNAMETVDAGGTAPLSPRLSASIKEGVSSGRLRPGGFVAPLSIYTDSNRTHGNADLINEQTYHYRVTTVDITGGETEKETAPVIVGTPKDLEPPRVPGRPRLDAHVTALNSLRGAQAARVNDLRMKELDQTLASKRPLKEQALTPFLGGDSPTIPAPHIPGPKAPSPEMAAMGLNEVRRARLSHMVATMPVKEMADLADAMVLHSKADGSAPAAKLVWAASPDADLKSYEVYRAEGQGPFQKMTSTSEPTWTDTSLEVGKAYRYVISATDKLGNESNRSDEGLVEVSDSQLKQKLAIKKLDGKSTTALPMGVPARDLKRPSSWVMKAADAKVLKANASLLKVPALTEGASTGGVFHPTTKSPKSVMATTPKGLAGGAHLVDGPVAASSPKTFSATDIKAAKFTNSFKAISKVRVNAINFMMVEPTHPKDIYVHLEWDRPLQGYPMEYVIYQAPQKFELKYNPRAVMTVTNFGVGSALMAGSLTEPNSASTGALAGSGVGPTSSAAMAPASGMRAPAKVGGVDAGKSPAQSTSLATASIIASTPDRHFSASKGLVATLSEGGLREAVDKKDKMVQSIVSVGPGEFARVSEQPVTTEHFAITFPAEVGQYNGATFYFRIQARTKEFGRTVEGPMSEVIEVKLPDVVPPPAPKAGSISITEITEESFNVGLDWTDVVAKDLAGYFVERQTMNYAWVDGDPQPTTPMGDPERLNKLPIKANSYVEKGAPGGYQRYTLRSVDTTGNVSDPQGYLDVFVPGEPVPGAPTGLYIAGNRLNWKAGKQAAGYSVWRSFSGLEDDYEQISGFLGSSDTGFNLPTKGTLHLKVVSRSATGMHQTASASVVRVAPTDSVE